MAQRPDGEHQLPASEAEPPSGGPSAPATHPSSQPASPQAGPPGEASQSPDSHPVGSPGPAGPSGQPPASPPPRPGLSYSAPAPIVVTQPPPRMVRLARTLWVLSFLCGLAVLASSFFSRDAHLERLRGVVDQMAPGAEAEALTTSVAIVFWGSLGTMVVVILLEAMVLGSAMNQRGWARWVMIPLLLAHIGAMLVAGAFLVPADATGSYVVLLWAAQLLLALAGLVLLFLPSSGAWFRSRQRP